MKYYLDGEGSSQEFATIEELERAIKAGFNRAGGYEWIQEIYDSEGNRYGCEWSVKVVEI